MDVEAFRRAGHAAVDRIADYYQTLQDRPVSALVEPGAISSLVAKSPPLVGEDFEAVAREFDRVVLPGITHWQHPSFFAFFPSNATFESIIADMFTGAVTNPGFNWSCSPSATELEQVMMDWIAQMLGLGDVYTNSSTKGRGVIMTSASESALTATVAARERALRFEFASQAATVHAPEPVYSADGRPIPRPQASYTVPTFENMPQSQRAELTSRLVMYGSTQTHSLAKKAAMILGLELRSLEVYEEDGRALRGETLRYALEEDTAKGLVPFLLIATVGTTNTGAVDNIEELTAVATDFPTLWIHVDAAWAGSYLALPECRSELFLDAINGPQPPREDPTEAARSASPSLSEASKPSTPLHPNGPLPSPLPGGRSHGFRGGSSRTSSFSSTNRHAQPSRRTAPDPETTLKAPGGVVHSFCANLHKAGLVSWDLSTLFVREKTLLTDALDITPAYLRTKHGDAGNVVDFRNSSLFLGRKFRSLKIYFVLRSYGLEGVRAYLRRTIQLAQLFESLVQQSNNFEIFAARSLALVVFRLNPFKNKNGTVPVEEEELDVLNKELDAVLQSNSEIAITGTVVGKRHCIRFVVGAPSTQEEHVRAAWDLIGRCADEAMASTGIGKFDRPTASN